MADISVYPRTDSNHETAAVDAGTTWENGAKRYRYVQVEDAAVAVGDVVTLSDTTGGEVTKDRAGGASLGNVVGGVALATVTDAYHGVVQTGGVALVKAAATIAAGTALAPSATDGLVAAATTSTANFVFAVSLGTSTATTSGAGLIYAKLVSAI